MQEGLHIWASFWQKIWEDWVTHIVEALNTAFLILQTIFCQSDFVN